MNILFSDTVLLHGLFLFLMLSSIVSLCTGAVLLLRPGWLLRVSKLANRWVSTRQMGRTLEQSIKVEQWLYRNSRVSGALLFSGAVYILYMFTKHIVRADILLGLAGMHLVPNALLEPLLDTLVLIFLSGALLALLVSLFLIFRPSMLRDMELAANQRVSLRQTLKPVEIQHGDLDRLVFQHVRLAGVLLLCGSLYMFVILVT